jgi:hypothetical protein
MVQKASARVERLNPRRWSQPRRYPEINEAAKGGTKSWAESTTRTLVKWLQIPFWDRYSTHILCTSLLSIIMTKHTHTHTHIINWKGRKPYFDSYGEAGFSTHGVQEWKRETGRDQHPNTNLTPGPNDLISSNFLQLKVLSPSNNAKG